MAYDIFKLNEESINPANVNTPQWVADKVSEWEGVLVAGNPWYNGEYSLMRDADGNVTIISDAALNELEKS